MEVKRVVVIGNVLRTSSGDENFKIRQGSFDELISAEQGFTVPKSANHNFLLGCFQTYTGLKSSVFLGLDQSN